jgi:regulator of sigma D
MTNTYTNKKERRYYYYKCYKVMREGKGACSIKEVNAEKLEQFLIENLSRIAQDNHYIESLTFKMLHNSGGRAGIELTEVWSKNVATRVSEVLINFKNKIQKATQVEKCLLFEKTISRINFSRESLEVIISIIDTSSPLPEGQNDLMGGKEAARMRAGAPYCLASACTGSSILKNGAVTKILSNMSIILPQYLLDKTRLKK